MATRTSTFSTSTGRTPCTAIRAMARSSTSPRRRGSPWAIGSPSGPRSPTTTTTRSEEHASELQSRLHLVCRLLLEKKKKNYQHQSQSHNEWPLPVEYINDRKYKRTYPDADRYDEPLHRRSSSCRSS